MMRVEELGGQQGLNGEIDLQDVGRHLEVVKSIENRRELFERQSSILSIISARQLEDKSDTTADPFGLVTPP